MNDQSGLHKSICHLCHSCMQYDGMVTQCLPFGVTVRLNKPRGHFIFFYFTDNGSRVSIQNVYI